MNANTSITDLLSAPLAPDWTIEALAEQVLDAIAAQRPETSGDALEIVLDAGAVIDRQAQRVLRPLLACLATKSAAEAGTPVYLFVGRLCFKRSGPARPVWITGQFENSPGAVRVTFRRFDAAPNSPGPTTASPQAISPAQVSLSDRSTPT